MPYNRIGASLAFVIATVLAAPSYGQETPTRAANAQGGISDIVVTARRTEERLQDVPVSVTALSGEFLDKQNMQDISSVPQFTPNLSILPQPSSVSGASIYIRGIGNQEPSSVAEQGVGIYLDGVYVARSAGAIFDLVDMERIEVLRGPQGTLFGRNTIGGAVQLVSRKPKDDFHTEIKAGYGRFQDWFVRGRVDTGYLLGSVLKASVTAMHHERDGFIDNRLAPDPQDPGALNTDAVMVGVEADLGALTANYTFDYNDREVTPNLEHVVAARSDIVSYFSQSASLGGDPFLLDTGPVRSILQAPFTDRFGRARFDARGKVWGHGLTLAYEVGDGLTLKSITGYRRFFQDTILNLTGQGNLRGVVYDPTSPTRSSVQPVYLFGGYNAPQRQRQFSQELQALGTIGDFNYVVGLYHFYEKGSENNVQALTIPLPPAFLSAFGISQPDIDTIVANSPGLGQIGVNLFPNQAFGGTAKSDAIFGQVSWKPASLDGRLELTGGLRYTSDKKTIVLRGDVNPEVRGRAKFDNVSWLASASYKFAPDIMGYARVSTGYRSGGLNPRTSSLNEFKPEKVRAYEAGLKADLFDRHLRLNLAAFLTEYSDMQIQQFAAGTGGATSLIVNAGKAQIRGVEAELTVKPVEGITFDGSVGYTDPKFKEFLFRDPTTNSLIDIADEARLPQSSKVTAHAGLEYSVPVGIGTFTARTDYSYRSSIYFFAVDRSTPFNQEIHSRPDHNLKARLSLSDVNVGGGTMEFGVWGDNLTNDKNIDFGIDWGSLGFGTASFKRPRTYGIDAKISF